MKSLKYILATIISLSASYIHACGPEYYEIPQPTHLSLTDKINNINTQTENLLLWRSQTDKNIKLEDICAVIYGNVTPGILDPHSVTTDGRTTSGLMSWVFSDNKNSSVRNTFIKYLYDTSDSEALQLIMMAKHIAGLRDDRNSPWYYPADKREISQGFDSVIRTIKAYKGKRFYNRYSLQLIRALFASAKYKDCIAAYNERFANVPDDDLMKSLSRDYAAGAALRIGDSKTATEYFASTGDVESIARFTDVSDPFGLAALSNPDSPKLLYYIEQHFNGTGYSTSDHADSLVVRASILPAARKIVQMKNVRDRAMWYYILAVGEGEFNNNYQAAYKYINLATKYPQGLYSDNIRGYRIVTEAALGNQTNLLANLKWLESKITSGEPSESNHWEQVMQNIVFSRIAPWYAKQGDIITAMQLANYGDNMPLNYSNSCPRYSNIYGDWETDNILLARKDPKQWNGHDYSNTLFQFMTMQTPQTIERYIASLSSTSPLASYLNSRSYTSLDYLYDIVGTRYLANRDYANAVRALSKVSDNYQKLLNVDRDGFLRRNPFSYKSDFQRDDWYEREHGYCPGPGSKDNINNHKKLYFAREMLSLERNIQSSNNRDYRALDRLRYAIGLENSFNVCWALTSYSRGRCYIADRNELTDLGYLTDNEFTYWNPLEDERVIRKATTDAGAMIKQAFEEITDPEVAAKANYMLYNVLTIARRYPNTEIGRMMAAECDNWSDWTKNPRTKNPAYQQHNGIISWESKWARMERPTYLPVRL